MMDIQLNFIVEEGKGDEGANVHRYLLTGTLHNVAAE